MVINDKLKGPYYRAPQQKLASRNNVLTTLNELVDYYNNLTKTLESMFDVITERREYMSQGLMKMYEKTVHFKKILETFTYDIDSHILEKMNDSIESFQNVITAFVQPYEANLFNHSASTDAVASNSASNIDSLEEWDRSVNILPTSFGIRWFGGKFSDKSFINTVNKQLELVKVNTTDGYIGEDIIHSNLIMEFFIYTPRGITWLVLGENGSLGYNLYVKYQTNGDSLRLDLNSENMRITKSYDLNKFDFEMLITSLVGNDVVKDGNVYIKVKTNIPANHHSGKESYMIYSKYDSQVNSGGVNAQATQEKNALDTSYGLMYHDNKDIAYVASIDDTLEDIKNKKFPKVVTPNLSNPTTTRVISNKPDVNKTSVGSRIFVTNGLFSQHSVDSNHNIISGHINGDYVNPFYSPKARVFVDKSFTDVEPVFNTRLNDDPKYFKGEMALDMYDETYINNPSLIYKNDVMFAVENIELSEKVIPNTFGIDTSTLSSDVVVKITNDERFDIINDKSLYQESIPLTEVTNSGTKIFKVFGIDHYVVFGTSTGVYYIDTTISRSGDVIRKIINNNTFAKCYDIIGNSATQIFLSTDTGIHILNLNTLTITISGIVNGEWSTMFLLNDGKFGAISRYFNTTIEEGNTLYKDSVGIMYGATFNTIKNVFPNNKEYYTILDSEARAELTNEDNNLDYLEKRYFQNEFTVMPDPARNRYFLFRYGRKMCVTQPTYTSAASTFDFTDIRIVNTLKSHNITSAIMKDNSIYFTTLLGENYVYHLPTDTVEAIKWNNEVTVNNRKVKERIYYLKTLNHLKNDDAVTDSNRVSCYVTMANNNIFFIPLDPTNEVLGITYTNGYYYALCNNDYIYKLDEEWNIVNIIKSKDAKEIYSEGNMLFIDNFSDGVFGGYEDDGTLEFSNVDIINGNSTFSGVDPDQYLGDFEIGTNTIETYKYMKTFVPKEVSDVGEIDSHYSIFMDSNLDDKLDAASSSEDVIQVGYLAKIDDDIRDDNKFFVYEGMLNLIRRYKLELTGGTVTEYPDFGDYIYTPLTPELIAAGPVEGTIYYEKDVNVTDKYELVSSVDNTAPVPGTTYYKLIDIGHVECTDDDFVVKDIYNQVNVDNTPSPEDDVEYFTKDASGVYRQFDTNILNLEPSTYELVDQDENPYNPDTQYWKETGTDTGVYEECTEVDFDTDRDGTLTFFENNEYYIEIPGTKRLFDRDVEYFYKSGNTYREWKPGEQYYTKVVIREENEKYIESGTLTKFETGKTYYTRETKDPTTETIQPSDESTKLLKMTTRRVPSLKRIFGKSVEDKDDIIPNMLNNPQNFYIKIGINDPSFSDEFAAGETIQARNVYRYSTVDKTRVTVPDPGTTYYAATGEENYVGITSHATTEEYIEVPAGTLQAWETDTVYFTRTIKTRNAIVRDTPFFNKLKERYGDLTICARVYHPFDIYAPVEGGEKTSPDNLSEFDDGTKYKIKITLDEPEYVQVQYKYLIKEGTTYYHKDTINTTEVYVKVDRDIYNGTLEPEDDKTYYTKLYEPRYEEVTQDTIGDLQEVYKLDSGNYAPVTIDQVKFEEYIPVDTQETPIPEESVEYFTKTTSDSGDEYNSVGTGGVDGLDAWDPDTTEYYTKVTNTYYKKIEWEEHQNLIEFESGEYYTFEQLPVYVPIPEDNVYDFFSINTKPYEKITEKYITPEEFKNNMKFFRERYPQPYTPDTDPVDIMVMNKDYSLYSFADIRDIEFENWDTLPKNIAIKKSIKRSSAHKLTPEEIQNGMDRGTAYVTKAYINTNGGMRMNNVSKKYDLVDTQTTTTPEVGIEYFTTTNNVDYTSAGVGGDTLTDWDGVSQYYTFDKKFYLNDLHTDEIYALDPDGADVTYIEKIVTKEECFKEVSQDDINLGMQLGILYFHKIDDGEGVRYEMTSDTSFIPDIEYYTLIDIGVFARVYIRDDIDINHWELGPGDDPIYIYTPISSTVLSENADQDSLYVSCERISEGVYWNETTNSFGDPTPVGEVMVPLDVTDEEKLEAPKKGYFYAKVVYNKMKEVYEPVDLLTTPKPLDDVEYFIKSDDGASYEPAVLKDNLDDGTKDFPDMADKVDQNIYIKTEVVDNDRPEHVLLKKSELAAGFDPATDYIKVRVDYYSQGHEFWLQEPLDSTEGKYKHNIEISKFLKTDLDNFRIEDFNIYATPIYNGAFSSITSDIESKINNNCMNKPRTMTLNVVHNSLERVGGNTNIRENVSATIEWFRTGYVGPNGYEIYTNSTNSRVYVNGVASDGNYLTAWFETGYYTPAKEKIYTNYNNSKFKYALNEIVGNYKDSESAGLDSPGWFDSGRVVPGDPDGGDAYAGEKIYVNYNHTKTKYGDVIVEGRYNEITYPTGDKLS